MQELSIKRAITYLLENALKSGKCIFLTSPLGVGKTTILKSLYQTNSFLNLDCCL